MWDSAWQVARSPGRYKGTTVDTRNGSGCRCVDGGRDGTGAGAQNWPVICREEQDGKRSTSEFLLIGNVFVGSDEDVETKLFDDLQELTVLDAVAPDVVDRSHLMSGERLCERVGNTLIEQDSHGCGCKSCVERYDSKADIWTIPALGKQSAVAAMA